MVDEEQIYGVGTYDKPRKRGGTQGNFENKSLPDPLCSWSRTGSSHGRLKPRTFLNVVHKFEKFSCLHDCLVRLFIGPGLVIEDNICFLRV